MMVEILVRASLEGGILVGMIWALCRFLPRLSPATRALLWWCAAAKFVLALVWTTPVHIPILPAAAPPVQEARMPGKATQLAVAGSLAPASAGSLGKSAGSTGADRGWTVGLVAVWMAGVVVAAGVGVRRWKHMAGVVGRTAAPSPATEVMAAGLACCVGLRRVPRVRMSEEIGTPLVTGIFQPVVLLPGGAFGALTERQQSMALCHELTHIKRADLWLGCVPAIAERVFFFHPLVHLAVREYALCREAACDAHVLRVLGAAPQEYGRLLLGLGVSRRRTSLAAAGAPWSFSTLKRRIAMLDGSSRRSTGSRIVAAAVIGVATLSLAPLRIAARPAAVGVDATIEAAARPPAAALPDAPDLAPPEGAAQKERDVNFIMFLDDHRTTMSGSTRDIERARRYLRGGEQMLWFRHDGQEYVVRDRKILDQVVALWRPVNEIGDEQGKLGGRQGELGARQGELGTRQGALGAEQGHLGARQGALGAKQGVMAAREGRLQTEAERRAFEEDRRLIEQEMRALDREMRALDAKMHELDTPMQQLGEEMEVLGKAMEVLGRKMEEEVRKAGTGMRALIGRAIATGAAERVK
jgi:bla regulator protein BlaR1